MFTRAEVLMSAYESARDRFDVDYSTFAAMTAEWDADPVIVDGCLVGAVLMNGPEIHACITPSGFRRWLTKGVLKRTLGAILFRYGFARTRVVEVNDIGRAFVERLGFVPVSIADGIITYEARHGH